MSESNNEITKKNYRISQLMLAVALATLLVVLFSLFNSSADMRGMASQIPWTLDFVHECTNDLKSTPFILETNQEARDVRTPKDMFVTYKESSEWPGMVDVTVNWTDGDSRSKMDALAIGGAYGQFSPYDFTIGDNRPEYLTVGSCQYEWFRHMPVDIKSDQGVHNLTISGLWGNHTYCFAIASSLNSENATVQTGPFATPKCERLTWRNEWGAMKQRPGSNLEKPPSA